MLDEKDRLTDNLITQKYLAGSYNMAAVESANSQLKDTFLSILRDEHQINHEVFNEMSSRGWYQTKQANPNDITQQMTRWNQELQRVQSTAFRQPGAQQAGYQAPFQAGYPQYGMQQTTGMQQAGNIAQQQPLYRPPQNPLI